MRRASPPLDERIGLKHGSGGRAMRALIEQVFLAGCPATPRDGGIGLAEMDDGAALRIGDRWLILTTDSHVIQPIFFPGGDIGRLAVAGTVNDLAMMGATQPLALTLAVIVEEGFPRADLERIQASVAACCAEAGTTIVTGDTKVMGRGEIDGIVLNTAGVGLTDRPVPDRGLRPGDRLIVTGAVGDHGLAIMATRNALALDVELRSDVAPLNRLVRRALEVGGTGVVAMKDPTRGGLASALHEMAQKSGVALLIDEAAVPVSPEARAVGELLGIDPLLAANEGKAVIGVRPAAAAAVLAAVRAQALGREAAIIGECLEVTDGAPPGRVILETGFGRRLLTEPDGELLPRIC
jgi:hydrogenase expression/formation protein HypE